MGSAFQEIFPLTDDGQALLTEAGALPRANDHPAYEAFEEQVQARSSAASDTYRKDELVRHGVEVLTQSSRDMKVLITLGDVLISAESPREKAATVSFIQALTRALGPYWPLMHPLPEARNWVRIRQGLLAQMMTSLERVLNWDYADQEQALGTQMLTAIKALAALPTFGDDFYDTTKALTTLTQQFESRLIQQQAPAKSPASGKSDGAAKSLPTRDLRQKTQELADQFASKTEDLDPPLVFQLRRKAAFLVFEGEVKADKGQTALTDISPDRVAEVVAAAKTPTQEALAALETTLQSRPLWLTGHRYAAEMAEALGGPGQADAIRMAVVEEVETLGAEVLDYRFKDGLKFADLATKSWINAPAHPGGSPEVGAGESVLSTLDAQLAESPPVATAREGTLALTNLAEALSQQGLGASAALLAAHVRTDLAQRDLLDWEAQIGARLKSLT